MCDYVLVRNDGWFVADRKRNPTGGSYTNKLQFAQVYATKELAVANQCVENERVRTFDDAMKGL